MVRRYAGHVGLAGSKTTAVLSTLGAHSLSSCSHFPPTENSKLVKPVILPSGRAKLVTKPAPTGSTTCTKTLGIERVCCRRAMPAGAPAANTTLGLSSISSVASIDVCVASAKAKVELHDVNAALADWLA